MQTDLIWEQLAGKGLEHLTLRSDRNIEVDSLAVGMLEGVPYRIKYRIVCDMDWIVRRVRIEDLLTHKTFVLIKGLDGSWTDEHDRLFEELIGCTDVDIRVTPFTNTLPINRLNLALHKSCEIAVAYFSVPNLAISRLDQRYTYLSREKDHRIYKYESLDSGFTSEITVDPDGLVIDYPGIFNMAWKQTR